MKARYVYTTVFLDNKPGCFDYPANVPLPRIGEYVGFNGYYGFVYNVWHTVTDRTVDIKIYIGKYDQIAHSIQELNK